MAVMVEWWATRWYTPLIALGVILLVLLIASLAVVELLAAAAPGPAVARTVATFSLASSGRAPLPAAG